MRLSKKDLMAFTIRGHIQMPVQYFIHSPGLNIFPSRINTLRNKYDIQNKYPFLSQFNNLHHDETN